MTTLFDSKKLQKLFGANKRLETLVSELFFTPKFVYKIKRPMKFEFADFTRRALRLDFAKKEFAKNKKFAPKIYLGKIPIYVKDGELNFTGKGRLEEVAIKMSRLPDNSSLDSFLARGRVSKKLAEKIAAEISKAHSKMKVTKKSRYYASSKQLGKTWDDALGLFKGDLLPDLLSGKEFVKIRDESKALLKDISKKLDERNKAGYGREIHGDLHSENIFVKSGTPFITDAALPVEKWENGDLAKDVGAISMDFDAHGKSKLGKIIVAKYVELRKDETLSEVLPFFKIYWAAARMWVYGAICKGGDKKALKKFRMYKKILFYYLKDQA